MLLLSVAMGFVTLSTSTLYAYVVLAFIFSIMTLAGWLNVVLKHTSYMYMFLYSYFSY